MFINGYTEKEGWEMTRLDWKSGRTVTRIIWGKNNLGNGSYAIEQFLPNGDLLFNSFVGTVRVPLKK